MRHFIKKYNLSKNKLKTQDIVVALTRSLFLSEKKYIVTGIIKAKASKPFVEKIITLAKRGVLKSIKSDILQSSDTAIINKIKDLSLYEFEKFLVSENMLSKYKDFKGDLNSRRRIISLLKGAVDSNDITNIIFNKSFDYIGRNGGYTRIVRYYIRKGDKACQAALSFV